MTNLKKNLHPSKNSFWPSPFPEVSSEKRRFLSFQIIDDKEMLRAFLRRDPVKNAYLLGDLEEPFFRHCTWFGAFGGGDLLAVCLLYEGLKTPTLLTAGEPDLIDLLFEYFRERFPKRGFAKILPEHLESFERYFELTIHGQMWCLALEKDHFRRRSFLEERFSLHRLTVAYSSEKLLEFFDRNYPGHYFVPEQLENGVYFALFEGERLLSVAGTHVYSVGEGVASLGNVVTEREYRGHGYAQLVVSRLAEELFAMNCHHLSLHVDRENRAAIHSYRRVGFRYHNAVFDLHYRRKDGENVVRASHLFQEG